MKNILITGCTDGIGREAAKLFAKTGHMLLLHGRSLEKLQRVKKELLKINESARVELFVADFSILSEVKKLAKNIAKKYKSLDVIINNAGVFVVDNSLLKTGDNLDVRFAVNTIAPYVLTKMLLPNLHNESRVVNLASAAQDNVNFETLKAYQRLAPDQAYAQSKLALIMWSMQMANNHPQGPVFIAINPKSFLGSKMVWEAYGRDGYDLSIGADILYKAALSDEFANANGMYFDNDYGTFSQPHPFALSEENRIKLVNILDDFVA